MASPVEAADRVVAFRNNRPPLPDKGCYFLEIETHTPYCKVSSPFLIVTFLEMLEVVPGPIVEVMVRRPDLSDPGCTRPPMCRHSAAEHTDSCQAGERRHRPVQRLLYRQEQEFRRWGLTPSEHHKVTISQLLIGTSMGLG